MTGKSTKNALIPNGLPGAGAPFTGQGHCPDNLLFVKSSGRSTRRWFCSMRVYAFGWFRKDLLTIAFVAASVLSATAQAPAIRDVTPGGVTRVYRSNETPDLAFDNARNFVGVRVDNSGLLQAEGIVLQLYGVSLLPRKKICMTAKGGLWACGQRAYLRLRTLVERRSIACQIKDIDKPGERNAPRIAVCKADRADVAISLLQEGLANLADGVNEKSYVAAASLAKIKKIGLWADAP